LPQATSLAAAISDHFGVEAELIKGKNGVFDVVVDGNLVFSKHKTGRFPQNDEILKLLGKS
jgi:selenoprotein W-related protein